MKWSNLVIGAHARSYLVWAAPACILTLTLALLTYQTRADPPRLDAWPATTEATSQPAGASSVMVYIKLVAEKRYGLLAHIFGKRNGTERQTLYEVNRNWWDNPLIAYADAPLEHPDVIGEADAEAIVGKGASANVEVSLTLVPHVEVALRTMPRSDAIKGTLTVSIGTVADFFDGGWTEMVRTKDLRVSFSFDTCDPHMRLQQTIHEIRTVPAFSLERYTRGHEKWEPRKNWPDESESGDRRTVIYGRDAILDVTGYRYVGP